MTDFFFKETLNFSAIKESEGAEYSGKIKFHKEGDVMVIDYDLSNQIDRNKKFTGNYVLNLPYNGSIIVFGIDLVTKLLNES